MQLAGGPYLVALGPHDATLVWATAEPSDTQLEYWAAEPCPAVHLPQRTTVHQVELTGLTPRTLYHYRATSGTVQGPILTFRTPAEEADKFAFVAYGDTAGRPERHARLAKAMLGHKPDFVVHTGGLVGGKGGLASWGTDFFEPAGDLVAGRPLVAAPGPDEHRGGLFRRLFPTASGATWRSFRHHHVEVFVLDAAGGVAPGDEQHEWLRLALARSKAQWKLVVVHPPLFGPHAGGARGALRRVLYPVLLRGGADLTFSSGEGLYARTVPIGSGKKPEHNAVVGFLTSAGASAAAGSQPEPWLACAAARPHFLLVEVDGERLAVTAVGMDGSRFDSIELTKAASMRLRKGALPAEALEGLLAFQPPGGFDLGRVAAAPATRTFSVAIENPYDAPIQGTLRWEIRGGGWQIRPEVLDILVPPLGLQRVSFAATARPPALEPRPTCSFLAGERRLECPHSPFRLRARDQ